MCCLLPDTAEGFFKTKLNYQTLTPMQLLTKTLARSIRIQLLKRKKKYHIQQAQAIQALIEDEKRKAIEDHETEIEQSII